MAVWGVNLSVLKLLGTQMNVLPLACIRMLLASLVMLIACRGQLQTLRRLSGQQLCSLIACAAVMVYANQVLVLSGMSRTSTTNVALIVALTPIAGMLIAWAVLKERLQLRRFIGALLGFTGVAAVILGAQAVALAPDAGGDLLVLLSVVCFAGGSALVQRLAKNLDPMTVSLAIHAFGCIMLISHASAFDTAVVSGRVWEWWTWPLLIFSGIGASGLGLLVWTRSISTIGASRTTAALYWVPIFGVGFAIALGEPATLAHAFGLAAVSAGTWLAMPRKP